MEWCGGQQWKYLYIAAINDTVNNRNVVMPWQTVCIIHHSYIGKYSNIDSNLVAHKKTYKVKQQLASIISCYHKTHTQKRIL